MIITVPNNVLFTPAKKVGKIDKKVRQIISQMENDLVHKENPKGVGLAAPQIGISLRIFITKPYENSPVQVYLNPEIILKSADIAPIERPEGTKPSLKREKKLEGCLSIPNIWGYLKRHKKVKLRYMDMSGKTLEKEFTGFEATIIQHETDHLNGILFTQRVLEQKQKLFTIEEKKGNEKLVEIEL